MPTRLPVGFGYRERRSGEIEGLHSVRLAGLLRSVQAERFRARTSGVTELVLQHLMAMASGNCKRGNERRAVRSGREA